MSSAVASPGPSASDGRWRSHSPIDPAVVVVYAILVLLLAVFGRSPGPTPLIPNPLLLLAGLVVIYFVRYASTSYSMDSDRFLAWRLFGSRSIPLETIRKIELANLRDLSPTGFFRGWGWRGRVWSPIIGGFDTVHTVSAGVMIAPDSGVPLFVSPKDPAAFVQELSRRARSYRGHVEVPGLSPETVDGPPSGSVPSAPPTP